MAIRSSNNDHGYCKCFAVFGVNVSCRVNILSDYFC